MVTNGAKLKKKRPTKRPGGQAEVYAFRPSEVDAIVAALQNSPRDLALFLVGINTELLPNQLLQLTWENVIKNGKITMEGHWYNIKREDVESVIIWNFGDDPIEALRKWRKVAKQQTGLIFPGRGDDEEMSLQHFKCLVRKWAILAGLKSLLYGCHSLRKTFGQHLYEFGYTENTLREMFGQSSLKKTSWYFRV